MSSAELVEWMAFYSLDPWGEQRADMRMAGIRTSVLHAAGAKRVNRNDFLLYPDASPRRGRVERESPKAILAKLARVSRRAKP